MRGMSRSRRSAIRFDATLVRALLMLAFTLLFAGQASAASERTLEHRVKAAYLYKFLSYAEWPPHRFERKDSPFVVGVLGSGEIHEELVRITRGRTAAGRPIAVKALRAGESLAGLHVLYVGDGELPVEAAATSGLLTVTDYASSVFAARSIINFRFIGGKVRFEVSLPAAERNHVRLSSRMLSVATRVFAGAG